MNCVVGAPTTLCSSGVFNDTEIAQLWDFYVTKSASSAQMWKLSDYSNNISYNAMIRIAGGNQNTVCF